MTTAITADTEHRFSGLPLGEYTLTVRAINSYGQQVNLPPPPSGLPHRSTVAD
nr:hypothetical protein [Escherichia coli]